MLTHQKFVFIITITSLYFLYVLAILSSQGFALWVLELLTSLFFAYIIYIGFVIALAFYVVITNEQTYPENLVSAISELLLPGNNYRLFEGFGKAPEIIAFYYKTLIKKPEEHYFDIDRNQSGRYLIMILPDIVVLGAIFSIFLGLTLFATLLQGDYTANNEVNTNAIHNIEFDTVAVSDLEISPYTITLTSSNSKMSAPRSVSTSTLTITPTSTPTYSPTPTSTSTPTPTITMTPTRRVIFGRPISSSARSAIALTSTASSSERESNDLPTVVILDFVLPVDNFRPSLLLVNFGHTVGMANWKLYFNQQPICIFGEYIFWPDTVLVLDMSKNRDERTMDDQLILKCNQISKDIFLEPVTISLQDHTGAEIDQYIYEKQE